MTEASVQTATIEDIATQLERVVQLNTPTSPPEWATANLTFGQLRVLFLLRDDGPVSIGALAGRLGVSLASASETIDRIERHELVERHHRQDDRRVVEVRLSERGEQLVREIAGIRLEGMRRLLGVLTPEELTEFDRLIRVIRIRLEATQAEVPSDQASNGGCR